jgi:hypothetical protein
MPDNTRRARDEAFWQTFADRYDRHPAPVNLENGYFGRMSRTVVEDYQRHIEQINNSNSIYVRQRFEQHDSLDIRAQLAELIGVRAQSIAFTQNATAGLQSLIRNYNRLEPGDQVLICDLEYDTVKGAMRWLARHRGVEVIEIEHTHPASFDSLLATYREAFIRYPKLKLMALTHVTHRTGLVMPVQAIAALAREHGVDIILDGAHALGQMEFDLEALGIAFAGYNLHKWIGSPLTLGFLYIAPQRLADIDPDMGEMHFPLTETFVALRADIRNWRWAGVPFYLRTGKRMPQKLSQIVIHFKEPSHYIFAPEQRLQISNKLIIRLQPDEGISLRVMTKDQGLDKGMQLRSGPLQLNFSDTWRSARIPDAYERLLLEVMNGNQNLFVRKDEIEAAWKWCDQLIAGWKKSGDAPKPYAAGSWGPMSSIALITRDGRSWYGDI